LGYGAIGDGKLINDDYVSAAGATAFGTTVSGPHRISRTESDIDGSHLWYLNADLGYKFLTFSGGRGSLKGFVSFQHWEEKYEAKGIKQLECTAVGTFCNPVGPVPTGGRTVITNEVEWNSIRLGLEGGYQITRRFSIDGSAAFIPYTSLKNEDIHHLRTDLRQDPSFSMSGTGIGANFDVSISYMIVQQLFFDLGYRYWWLQVKDGTWKNHPVNFPSETANLNEFQSIRHGVTLGLSYKF
jgi:opacity protein-like surface antigen